MARFAPPSVLIALLSFGCPGPEPMGTDTDADDDGSSGAPQSTTSTGAASESGDASETGSGGEPVEVPDPVTDDCITDVSAGHHVFACGGFDFDVEIPASCIGFQCGLVVDVHGYTMSADMEDANTNMRALGRERGYIVVQPNAEPDPPNASWVPGEDDLVVHDFAMRTVAAFHLDPSRLHFTGFSQGGFMSWRFLCAYGDVYASVAPGAACGSDLVAGCAFEDDLAGRPHILYIHGLADALVSYACAEPQRDAVLSGYAITGDAEIVADEDAYRWRRWTNAEGVDFEMIDHDYTASAALLGGHCYPGSTDTQGGLPGQVLAFGCTQDAGFVYGETVMDFFEAHPKP